MGARSTRTSCSETLLKGGSVGSGRTRPPLFSSHYFIRPINSLTLSLQNNTQLSEFVSVTAVKIGEGSAGVSWSRGDLG